MRQSVSSERNPSPERLAEIARGFAGRRVLVVGDAVADQFLYGEISRVSREAPVLILRHERTETLPGGAANCVVNLAALGARAALVGVVGNDAAGAALRAKLEEAGVDCEHLARVEAVGTPTKVRVLAGHAHSPRQQVIRVDYESEPLSDAATREELMKRLRAAVPDAEAVVISDYNYGVADSQTAQVVRELTRASRVPALVDSRFRLTEFAGLTSATPNEDEVEQLLGGQRLAPRGELIPAAEELRARLRLRALLVTRGRNGMVLLEEGAESLAIPAVGSREAVDVTGAGDTVIATYALALAAGASFAEAAHLANHAGGIVVMKRGTASVTPGEFLASVARQSAL